MKHAASLLRLLDAAIARLRFADAAWALGRVALPLSLLTTAGVLVAMRRLGAPEIALWLAAAPLPCVLAWAWLRPHARRKVARRLDVHFSLDDQLGAALELDAKRPAADPRTTAIVTLVQQRADALAGTLDPRAAIPIRVPAPRWHDGVAAALAIAAWFVPPERARLAETTLHPVLVLPAEQASAKAGLDLALAGPLRQSLAELTGAKDKPAEAATQILGVLDALERGEIDRATALEQLEELEREIADAEAELDRELREDPSVLAEGLQELSEALQDEELTEKAGDALDHGDGEKAEQALSEAGEQAEASESADEQMKRALSEAERRLGKQANERESSETAKQLDEAERRLRKEEKKKPEDPEEAAEQERRLKQQREKVEQLRRQHEREMAAQRKLDELRRNAEQAAKNQAGSEGRKRELDKLGRGMKDASRTAQSSSRMQGARDALEEAKTFVRRSGEQGAGQDRRAEQFRRFDKKAKGDGKKEGQEGKDGKGKGKGSSLLVEGEVGEGEPDAMMEMPGQGEGEGQGEGKDGQGEGKDGKGQGQGEGQDGQGEGQEGQGEGEGQGQGQGQSDSPSSSPDGDGVGTGSQDPLGDPTAMGAHVKDVRVSAKRGRGQSKAEILKDASQHGFASEPYRKTYERYRDHAQSTIDSDAFPAAQRRLVKRYYQMIQGR